jgi:hypothetical protein
MRSIESYIRNLALAAAVALTLSACVVVPAHGYYAGGYYAGAVTIAPSAPQVEVYGAPPAAGYVWLGGYWNWVGGRHVWVGGHWSAPHPGYRWEPNRWEHRGDGWHMTGGAWIRR